MGGSGNRKETKQPASEENHVGSELLQEGWLESGPDCF